MDLALIWTIRLALVALLVMPVVFTGSTIFPFIVGKALYSRVLIEIALALWLLLILRRPEYRPARSWLVAILGVFILASLISALFGTSFQRSIWSNWERMQGVWDLAHWGIALLILMSVVKGLRQWRILFSLNLAVGMFITLLGIYEWMGWKWSGFPFLNGEDVSRLDISLGNATFVGAYGMVMSLTALALLADSFRAREEDIGGPETPRRRGRRRRAREAPAESDYWLIALRVFYMVAAIAGVWMAAFSGSRGAIFLVPALLTAGVLYSIWGTQIRIRLLARVTTGLLAVAVAVFLVLGYTTGVLSTIRDISPLFSRMLNEDGRLRLGSHSRDVSRRSGLEAFSANPITGVGIENYAVAWNRYMRGGDFAEPFRELDQAHSKPVEILATTGILGGISYAAFWLWIFWLIVRRVSSRSEGQLFAVFIGGALVGYLAQLLFLFDTSSTLLLLILLAAYAGTAEAAVAEKARRHVPGDILALPAERPAIVHEPRASPGRRRQAATTATSDIVREAAVPAVIIVALFVSLYFFHWRAFEAAQLARAILFGPPVRVTLQRAIDDLNHFGQLSTYSHRLFLDSVSFAGVQEDLRNDVLTQVDQVARTALDAEPEDLKLRLAAVRFYRKAAAAIPARRDELLAEARIHSDRALEIGPHTFGALRDQVLQALAERDIEAAREAVRIWKTDNPIMNEGAKKAFTGELQALENEFAGKQ